jgi:aspartate carbamoyltransferase catalytic subunit
MASRGFVFRLDPSPCRGNTLEAMKPRAESPAPSATQPFQFNRRHLLGLEELSAEEITCILDNAESMKGIFTRSVKKVPTLRGRMVCNLFFENSTRTRTSFELAAKRLSADVVNFNIATSSVAKGESLLDTARTIQAMHVDIVVIRHSCPGTPHLLSRRLNMSVINAGDGAHEHPTQGLLDTFTMREKKGRIAGLKVAIVGDILHSRVARSNIWALTKLGARVALVGPSTLVPRQFEKLGCEIHHNLKEGIAGADVINLLRIQLERQRKNLFPSIREYRLLYGLNRDRLRYAKPDVLVMHPGPVNRGVEISQDVADGPHSVINEQVTNGIAVRMAVLYLLSGNTGTAVAGD